MNLKESVSKQLAFSGRTPGGCKLVIHNLLDNGQNIFQFMQLFNEKDIEAFYHEHAEEIDEICAEDQELGQMLGICEGTKIALERTLMLIEVDVKNECNNSH